MRTILRLLLPWCLALTALAGAREQEESALTIVSASYGTEDTRVDVSDLVRSLVAHDCLLLRGKWSLAPDPAPGVLKDVRIVYRIFGTEKSAKFQQDEDVILPASPDAFFIVSGRYGAGDQHVDVTDALRAAVQDGRLHLAPDWKLGRIDPAFGKVKIVEITYLQDGMPKTAKFKQTEEINLP